MEPCVECGGPPDTGAGHDCEVFPASQVTLSGSIWEAMQVQAITDKAEREHRCEALVAEGDGWRQCRSWPGWVRGGHFVCYPHAWAVAMYVRATEVTTHG